MKFQPGLPDMRPNRPMAWRLSALALVVASVCLPVSASADPGGWLWGKSSSSSTNSQTAPASTQASAAAEPAPTGQSVVIQNLLNQVQQMQQDIRDMRGKLEVQSNEIDRLKSSQRDGFASLDSRIGKLEQAAPATGTAANSAPTPPAAPTMPNAPAAPVAPTASAAGSAAAAGAATAAGAAASTPAPGAGSTAGAATTASGVAAGGAAAAAAAQTAQPNPELAAKQQQQYNKAFGLLKDGQYDAAIQGFQSVIDTDPAGTWTPSALFWQGETYYVEQKRTQALAAYQKIITDFPDSGRVPDAMLKTGYIAYDRSQNAKARSIFQQVIAKYPGSQAANLAKARMARMDREHR